MSERRVPLEDLPPLHRAALELLWDGGPATVQELHAALAPDGSSPYTTVLTALQRLEQAGWVTHAAPAGKGRGRAFVYSPACTREEARDRVARRVVDRLFAGDPFALAQRLVGHEALSAEELAELRRLIDRRRREKPGGGDAPGPA